MSSISALAPIIGEHVTIQNGHFANLSEPPSLNEIGIALGRHVTSLVSSFFTTPLLIEANQRHNTKQQPRCQRGGGRTNTRHRTGQHGEPNDSPTTKPPNAKTMLYPATRWERWNSHCTIGEIAIRRIVEVLPKHHQSPVHGRERPLARGQVELGQQS